MSAYSYNGENVLIVTGLPGRGKTLLALWLLNEIAKDAGRPVYVSGVRGLKPRDGWEVLEKAEEWPDTPEGSIILIDEGQRIFRPAGAGTKVPREIAEIETIRHHGRTLIITTQHPMLLHGNVRKLSQAHLHLVRKFGAERADVYRWDMCADVGTRSALLAATKTASSRGVWAYPKEVYSWYESSEMHTVKKRFPWQKAAIIAAPVVAVALIGVAVWKMATVSGRSINGEVGHQPGAVQTAPAGTSRPAAPPQQMTPAQYVEAYHPRIAGLAYTAPVYDAVTQPVRAPVPAACVASAKRCQCYSQQGTRLSVPDPMCRQFAETGFFRAFDDTVQAGQGAGAELATRPPPAQPVQVPSGVTLGGHIIADSGSYGGVPPIR